MAAVKLEINRSIAKIVISRPKALNALNSEVLDELGVALSELEGNKEIRALIITGDGEKAFVAGADIKEINALNSDTARSFAKKGHQVFRRIEVLTFPTIAAVNGFALGGGLELALACDFIIASDSAVLGLPEVTLGLIPGFGGTQRLSRKVSPSWALRLITSAEKLDAETALRIGLVTEIVPQSMLIERAEEIAKAISKYAPIAIASARRVVEAGLDLPLDEALLIEQDAFGDLFRSADVKEGLAAFIEKRKPNFEGK